MRWFCPPYVVPKDEVSSPGNVTGFSACGPHRTGNLLPLLMNCWLKADAPGQFPPRCVGACCGAATAAGADLVDEKTVGLGPGDGLRRTVVLMLAGADAARLGAGAACTRVGLAVVAIVGIGARGVVVARGAGFGAGFGARTTFFGAGFAAGAGVICTTLGTALGCAAGAVATWPVDGRALQITLRSRETRGTHVTLPSIPARIYTQPRLSTY